MEHKNKITYVLFLLFHNDKLLRNSQRE